MDNADPPDADPSEMVARIKQRDIEALASYIDANRSQLTGFLRSITGEHLLAVVELDDLLQEVSTAALTGLKTAPLEQYEPMEWLQQIARRRVVDAHRFHFDAQRRDAGRQKSIHGAGGADASVMGIEQMLAVSMTSASAAMSRDIRMIRIQQAIEGLSEEQRTAIRMRYVDGLPTKRIAEKIGKTDVATRVLLSRSMRQLEKQLEDVKPTR
jgi:RNA polymerase sigma-70 factor (ECF subfamily)